jgi:hypothetical protein
VLLLVEPWVLGAVGRLGVRLMRVLAAVVAGQQEILVQVVVQVLLLGCLKLLLVRLVRVLLVAGTLVRVVVLRRVPKVVMG